MDSSFLQRVALYFLCFILSLYGLQAFDYHRFLKRNAPVWPARVLYFLIGIALAYLSAQFVMGIMLIFHRGLDFLK